MNGYSEKLRHPKWQKKRLEILNRDGFKCRFCRSEEETLHVHHLSYIKGNDPWDYENSSLITLCHACHDYDHDELNEAKNCIISALRSRGAMSADVISLAVAFDDSGSNDSQISKEEWDNLSVIIGTIMKYRNKGGSFVNLKERIFTLCAKEA